MNLNPPKWAIALCAIWPVSVAFTMALPLLAGIPVLSWGYVEAVVIVLAWVLLLFFFFLKLERWSFALFAAGVALWLYMEWTLWAFGMLTPAMAIWDVAAIFGAVWCLSARRVAVSMDDGIKVVIKRAMAVAGAVAGLVGAAAFADSFRCESTSGQKSATAQSLVGTWLGSHPGMSVMNPVRLILKSDGTGSLAFGRRMVAYPGGFRVHWLMRGHCLHYGATMTDYFTQFKACPQLSTDGQTLTFRPRGPSGANVFHRQAVPVRPLR